MEAKNIPLFDRYTTTLREELSKVLAFTQNHIFLDLSDFIDNPYGTFSANREEVKPREVAIVRQINELDKRFIGLTDKVALSQDERDTAAWIKFQEYNEKCRIQNNVYDTMDSDVYATLDFARNDIYNAFWRHAESEDFEFYWHHNSLVPVKGFSSGPGSCTGVQGLSLMEKYSSDWQVSSESGIKYLQVLRKIWKPVHDLANFSSRVVSCVKATFVPKDLDISRLIAPQLNGDLILQYPAESCLRKMLEIFGIDLETQQQKNREMARVGSLHDNLDIFDHSLLRRSVRYCTIDLKSASDLLGKSVCLDLLPPPLYQYLDVCRSSAIEGLNKENVELHMMATMGNAYCFPLQTIIFSALVRAVYFRLGIPLIKDGKYTYGVYGDDIIVDITAYDHIIKLLKNMHMEPNTKKSFSHGFFRESCGGDYLCGYDIRPIYVETLDDDADIYSLANRLIDWCSRHSCDCPKTISLLLGEVALKTIVPMDFGTHEGLRVPEVAIPFLPKDWRKNFVVASTIDMDYCFNKHTENFDLNISCAYFQRTLNSYPRYDVIVVKRETGKKYVGLKDNDMSAFYYLRGGIEQHARCEDKFIVPTRGTVTSASSRCVSLWDAVDVNANAVEARYWQQILGYYAFVLARVFRAH